MICGTVTPGPQELQSPGDGVGDLILRLGEGVPSWATLGRDAQGWYITQVQASVCRTWHAGVSPLSTLSPPILSWRMECWGILPDAWISARPSLAGWQWGGGSEKPHYARLRLEAAACALRPANRA